MVQLNKYLTTRQTSSSSLPYLNSLFIETASSMNLPYNNQHNFKAFMKWARRSPHLMGFLNVIVTDILSDEMNFVALEENEEGVNRVKKAKEFWRVNQGNLVLEETLYDWLINGIGYNWIGKIDDLEFREYVNVIAKKLYPDLEGKEFEFKATELFELTKKGDISSFAKKLRHIPASTVTIDHDMHGVRAYVQQVNVNTRRFTPDEVIVHKLFPLDGKPYPFPPMEAILSEVYLIWLISQNYVSLFENGGHPDKIFILPKELAGSKNHRKLVETLKKYKKIQNKHGNMVFTGDIKVEDLMQVESQMENKELALYLVGVLAMMYGVPSGRIPFLIGKSANQQEAGALADTGYWRKISVWQSKIEEAYNNSLFRPFFGVEMKFRRGYLQDEVRETSNEASKNTVVEQRLKMGLWTLERAAKYLGVPVEELEEAQKQKKEREQEEMSVKTGLERQNLPRERNVQSEEAQRYVDKRRQQKQIENQTTKGKEVRE